MSAAISWSSSTYRIRPRGAPIESPTVLSSAIETISVRLASECRWVPGSPHPGEETGASQSRKLHERFLAGLRAFRDVRFFY